MFERIRDLIDILEENNYDSENGEALRALDIRLLNEEINGLEEAINTTIDLLQAV